MLRTPHCLDNRLTDGGKVVSPKHQPRPPSEMSFFCFWYSFLLEAESQGLVRPEGLGKLEKINSLHWVSNPRPSGLQHSALTSIVLGVRCLVDSKGKIFSSLLLIFLTVSGTNKFYPLGISILPCR
jgi:hypothetical protein